MQFRIIIIRYRSNVLKQNNVSYFEGEINEDMA